jgi:hypothetical protein
VDRELNQGDDGKDEQEQSVARERAQRSTEVGKEPARLLKGADQDEEEQGASKESAKGDSDGGKGLSTVATVIISLVTAVITSLLSPYLVERWKDADLRHQLDRAKQEKIMATQFDTVERFNAMFWRYRQAAGFLMFDFTHGQSDKLLERHLKEFEDLSAEANREMPVQAFRARMYFDSIYVNNKLFKIWRDIFTGVDDEISRQLLQDKNTPHVDDENSRRAWLKIDHDINQSMLSSEESLNEVYQLIGKSNIDRTMRPGADLKLYRLSDDIPQEPDER